MLAADREVLAAYRVRETADLLEKEIGYLQAELGTIATQAAADAHVSTSSSCIAAVIPREAAAPPGTVHAHQQPLRDFRRTGLALRLSSGGFGHVVGHHPHQLPK